MTLKIKDDEKKIANDLLKIYEQGIQKGLGTNQQQLMAGAYDQFKPDKWAKEATNDSYRQLGIPIPPQGRDPAETYEQLKFPIEGAKRFSNPGLSIAGVPQQIKGPVPHGIIFQPGGPHIDSSYIENKIKNNWQPMRIQDIKPGGPQLPWFLSQISQLTPAEQLKIIRKGAEVYKRGGTSKELRDTIEDATYPDWRGNPSGSIRQI